MEFPARQDAERHQEGGQDDEQHRNAVDAHVIGDRPAEPVVALFDELEVRVVPAIEPEVQINSDTMNVMVVQQRDAADVALGDLVVVPDQQSR